MTVCVMPTNKQRVTLNIPQELYDALEACAVRSNRTLANQATIALEEFLLKTGDLASPVKLAMQGRPRKSSIARGSKKANSDNEVVITDQNTTETDQKTEQTEE